MSLPIKINDKALYEIMLSEEQIKAWEDEFGKSRLLWTDAEVDQVSIFSLLYPTSVVTTSETYSRDAERTADYELEDLTVVNRKAKIEIEWNIIKYEYVVRLMSFLGYNYDFKVDNIITPVKAPTFTIIYNDFIGQRTMDTYLGQTIDGTLEEYEGTKYWRNFRIAFPER